jgi:ribosomal protein S18 acetylase RimI-like enzyme
MGDMLVSLLQLPDNSQELAKLREIGITIRKVQPMELSILARFVTATFGEGWTDQALNGFAHQPPTCYIATHNKKIIGFAAYECTCRNFFGPTGVHPDFRSKGIGQALLIACMHAMRELGYAYAVIGSAGPVDFYARHVGAIPIPDSTPGIYTDMLDREEPEATSE